MVLNEEFITLRIRIYTLYIESITLSIETPL